MNQLYLLILFLYGLKDTRKNKTESRNTIGLFIVKLVWIRAVCVRPMRIISHIFLIK